MLVNMYIICQYSLMVTHSYNAVVSSEIIANIAIKKNLLI